MQQTLEQATTVPSVMYALADLALRGSGASTSSPVLMNYDRCAWTKTLSQIAEAQKSKLAHGKDDAASRV